MYVINALACAVLLMLAVSDLRQRRLPNRVVAAFAALYLAQAWVAGVPRAGIEAHLLTAFAALVLAAALVYFGWLGGGDAKLFAAVFLWTGPAYASTVFFIVSFTGLMLALAQLAARKTARDPAAPAANGWLAPVRGVPYGVALAAGGIAAVWLPLALMHAGTQHHAAQALPMQVRLI